MKKLILVFACICALHATAFSQKVFTEDFLFGPMDNLDNNNDWFKSGIDFPYNIKVNTLPGLLTRIMSVRPGYRLPTSQCRQWRCGYKKSGYRFYLQGAAYMSLMDGGEYGCRRPRD